MAYIPGPAGFEEHILSPAREVHVTAKDTHQQRQQQQQQQQQQHVILPRVNHSSATTYLFAIQQAICGWHMWPRTAPAHLKD